MTRTRRVAATALGTTALTTAALLATGTPRATAATLPPAPTARAAVTAPATLGTLARFFARDGAAGRAAAPPRVEGAPVAVHVLSPDFVAGRPGAPVARVEFHAARAVSSDGRKASVWTVRQGRGWQVVNIATGDDETRYAQEGSRELPGGTVFREPQIDAWYVHKGGRVLPLDEDAVRAVGANGTTLAGYRNRVAAAYRDKLPGSAYAGEGRAGGYATHPGAARDDRPQAGLPAGPAAHLAGRPATGAPARPEARPQARGEQRPDRRAPAVAVTAAAVAALALAGATALRRSRRTGHGG
ncbi:hypothetical protein ACLGI4_22535 [Streptomyces sp. HMX112]|uniref:hypothetical protein n=1 Tax=Streptomyces sp. HMX112 TaxID=3390850 RepID=UPI003A810E1E